MSDEVMALRAMGLTFPQIGVQLGIHPEAARGLYRRANARSGRVAGLAGLLARPGVFAAAPLRPLRAADEGGRSDRDPALPTARLSRLRLAPRTVRRSSGRPNEWRSWPRVS